MDRATVPPGLSPHPRSSPSRGDGHRRLWGIGKVLGGLLLGLGLALSWSTPGQERESSEGEGGRPLAFGPFHLPTERFAGGPFTGAFRALRPESARQTLEAARAAGTQLIFNLAGSRRAFQNPDGSFSLERFRARLERFRALDLEPYVEDGTVIGHVLFDEPQDPTNWGGRPVPLETIEQAAALSKALFPKLPVGIGAPAPFLRGFRWEALDFAMAQYAARRGDLLGWLREQTTAAEELGLGLALSLNVLAGSAGGPLPPPQLREWGTLLAQEPSACALLLWKHDDAYFGRPDVAEVVAEIAAIARSRTAPGCTGAAP